MERAIEFIGDKMLKDIILVIASCLITTVVTTVLNEWRFRARQKEMFIKEIVESFLKHRKEAKNNQVYELRYLQSSGILLLKRERDAEEVLKQIELRDKGVNIPNFIREKGILQGLQMAIKNGINIGDSKEVTIQEIGEKIKDRN
jgi:hypothetical protein